jgi:hypothetical protein
VLAPRRPAQSPTTTSASTDATGFPAGKRGARCRGRPTSSTRRRRPEWRCAGATSRPACRSPRAPSSAARRRLARGGRRRRRGR